MVMKWFMVFFLGFVHMTHSFLVLVGQKELTEPLAKRYSDFYRVPTISPYGYIRPVRFIMVADENDDLGYFHEENITILNVKDYPHHDKDPNYFLSWIIQNK